MVNKWGDNPRGLEEGWDRKSFRALRHSKAPTVSAPVSNVKRLTIVALGLLYAYFVIYPPDDPNANRAVDAEELQDFTPEPINTPTPKLKDDLKPPPELVGGDGDA